MSMDKHQKEELLMQLLQGEIHHEGAQEALSRLEQDTEFQRLIMQRHALSEITNQLQRSVNVQVSAIKDYLIGNMDNTQQGSFERTIEAGASTEEALAAALTFLQELRRSYTPPPPAPKHTLPLAEAGPVASAPPMIQTEAPTETAKWETFVPPPTPEEKEDTAALPPVTRPPGSTTIEYSDKGETPPADGTRANTEAAAHEPKANTTQDATNAPQETEEDGTRAYTEAAPDGEDTTLKFSPSQVTSIKTDDRAEAAVAEAEAAEVAEEAAEVAEADEETLGTQSQEQASQEAQARKPSESRSSSALPPPPVDPPPPPTEPPPPSADSLTTRDLTPKQREKTGSHTLDETDSALAETEAIIPQAASTKQSAPGERKWSVHLTLTGPYKSGEETLDAGENLIGAIPPCRICIDDPQVSGVHARFLFSESTGALWIEDLNSTNGSYLMHGTRKLRLASPIRVEGKNYLLTCPQELQDGDNILLGNTTIEIKITSQ